MNRTSTEKAATVIKSRSRVESLSLVPYWDVTRCTCRVLGSWSGREFMFWNEMEGDEHREYVLSISLTVQFLEIHESILELNVASPQGQAWSIGEHLDCRDAV